MRDREGYWGRWPTKVIFRRAEVWVLRRPHAACLALRFSVRRENGGARRRLMNIYIHHVFSKGNIRRLDFGINERNDPIQSTSSGTTLGYVKWGWRACTTSTVRDTCTLAVLCPVTRPFLWLHSYSWRALRAVLKGGILSGIEPLVLIMANFCSS